MAKDGRRPGRLYVVATPIGNLEDLTLRAARIFSEVTLVAAEDTRVTGKLLAHIGVKVPMLSYRDENERREAPRLVERLLAGEDIALASDAGTPCISDPGYRLVRAAALAGIEVVAVAGPSALTAFLSAAGLATDRFSFEGFAPTREMARAKLLESLQGCGRTVVFYESPRRVVRLLNDIASALGDPFVAVGRELTKLHEEVRRGAASEIAQYYSERPPKGELVVGIEIPAVAVELVGEALDEAVAERARQGLSAKDITAALRDQGAARREVYAAYQRFNEK